MQRIEIVGERRRPHDAAFRSGVVAASLVPGTRVVELARRHGVCKSLIYRWRRAASRDVQSKTAVQLLPVRITEARQPEKRPASSREASAPVMRRPGVIEIELDGGVRVRVDGDVSLAALRRVVTALRG